MKISKIFLIVLSCLLVSLSRAQTQLNRWSPAKKWALCMGASDYQSIGKLNFSSRDAIDFGNALVADIGFQKETVKILADAPGYESTSAENVNRALDTILNNKDLDRGDLFILYFSGHGVGLTSGDYWLPNNATPETYEKVGIPVKSVISRLQKAGLKQILVIADACRAGFKSDFGTDLISLSNKANIAVILGCQPGQKSYELPRQGHGALTYMLLKSLKKKTAATPEGTNIAEEPLNVLSASSLGKKLAINVPLLTAPEYGANAQVPFCQASERQEVFLAIEVPANATETNYKKLTDKLIQNRIPNDPAQAYLYLTAQALVDQGRFSEAYEYFRATEGLGELSSRMALHFAFTMNKLGQAGEVERLVKRYFRKELTTQIDASIALLGEPEWVGVDNYKKALAMFLSELDSPFDRVDVELRVRQSRLKESNLALVSFLESKLPSFPNNSRQSLYFKAAIGKLKYDNASSKMLLMAAKSVKSAEGEAPDNEQILDQYYSAQNWQMDTADSRSVISEALELVSVASDDHSKWLARLAKIEFYESTSERLFVFKRLLKSHNPDAYLLEILPVTGGFLAQAKSEIVELAKTGKNSLARQLALWIIESGEKQSIDAPLSPELIAISNNRASVVGKSYNALESYYANAMDEYKLDEKSRITIYRQLFYGATRYFDDLVASELGAMTLGKIMLHADLPYQSWGYFCNELHKTYPAYDDSVVITPLRITMALNVGDFAKAEAYWTVFAKAHPDATRPAVSMGVAYLQRGMSKESLQILNDFGPKLKLESSFYATFLKILNTEFTGGAKEVMDENKTLVAPELPWLRLMARVFSLTVLKEEPGLGLIASLGIDDPEFTGFRVQAMKRCLPILRKAKDAGIVQFATALGVEVAEFGGNFDAESIPLYEGQKLADYVGNYNFDIRPDSDLRNPTGKMSMKVTPSGEVSGEFIFPDTKLKMTGTVDALGNLKAELSDAAGKKMQMRSKFPSLKILTDLKAPKFGEKVFFNVLTEKVGLLMMRGTFVIPKL
jgi:hypothetical protein